MNEMTKNRFKWMGILGVNGTDLTLLQVVAWAWEDRGRPAPYCSRWMIVYLLGWLMCKQGQNLAHTRWAEVGRVEAEDKTQPKAQLRISIWNLSVHRSIEHEHAISKEPKQKYFISVNFYYYYFVHELMSLQIYTHSHYTYVFIWILTNNRNGIFFIHPLHRFSLYIYMLHVLLYIQTFKALPGQTINIIIIIISFFSFEIVWRIRK